jgi:UDP-4-amino-4,6-dideoxy-N-acetyl-beta-L-altrosamine transaminase
MIPYGRQCISNNDIDAVVDVLKSDFLTQGPKVPEFEAKLSSRVGVKHAVAVNSATSALHIACMALGLGGGDWLWTSPITFVASANCGLYCGAQVDFVDVDPVTNNICSNNLQDKLAKASLEGCLPKVLVVVHLCGLSCDMKAIYNLSLKYGFKIIEDASHAIGGEYFGAPVGVCKFSDITVFSFHPVKILTTAEGGCAVTNQDELASNMRLHSSHGVTRDPVLMVGEDQPPWYYQQIELGYNYRMTDLQAALGISQLDMLDTFLGRRQELAARYDRLLSGLPVVTPVRIDSVNSAWHLYIVGLNLDVIKNSRLDVFNAMRNSGIGVNVHYIPVYHQPYYAQMGFDVGYCPNAERFYERALSLPLHVGLTEEEQDQVVKCLKEAILK